MVTASDLFRPLSGRTFDHPRALSMAVLVEFNEHLADIPPGYTYQDLIEWGRQNGWVNGMTIAREYVVEFGACSEAVIRVGDSPDAVRYPDELGCEPTRVRPLAEVRLRSMPWHKNGELRVTLAEEPT